MAIKPDVALAPNITPADANYLYGSSKNETAPGLNNGTPQVKIRADDIFGLQQALLKAAAIIPSGTADNAFDKNSSQYLQAILHIAMTGLLFDETGVADAYVLDVVSTNPAPAKYAPRMIVIADFVNANTGASTADVEGLGAKAIFLNGSALVGGEIPANSRTVLQYDEIGGRFDLIQSDIMAKLTITNDSAVTPLANTLVKDNIIKAWINFNGIGVIAIRDSYNVSIIIDNGVGDYTVNFITGFANTDYSVVHGCNIIHIEIGTRATGSVDVLTKNSILVPEDAAAIMLQICGDQ